MGLASILRRALPIPTSPSASHTSTPSRRRRTSRLTRPKQPTAPTIPPSPPIPPTLTQQQAQEQLVIASYHARLTRLSTRLAHSWHALDLRPDEYAPTVEIRHLRASLQLALESYYAALGAQSPAGIEQILDQIRVTDTRLAQLDAQVAAEVSRFESAVSDLARRNTTIRTPSALHVIRADADDILMELELYRATSAPVIDSPTRRRLDEADATLRAIVQRAASVPHTTPITSSYQFPTHIRAAPARTNGRVHSAMDATSWTKGNGEKRQERVEEGSSESGDDAPRRLMISRTRTLRDMAESVMGLHEPGGSGMRRAEEHCLEEDGIDRTVGSPPTVVRRLRGEAGEAGDGRGGSARSSGEGWRVQPELALAKNASFASTLYYTRHQRVESISDAGILLQRSNVRGDGRCLFRSLVRGHAVARGNPVPGERTEREEADQLRERAVEELIKYRKLLARFFVIEGDFGQYTKKMSHPRTYGGEPELLMLAKLLHVPIAVYIMKNGLYRQIQVYGKQYRGQPLRILYSDGVHYDALLVVSR